MTDREFLKWLHRRLVNVYHNDEHVDFMHKLRAVIWATPKDKESVNMGTWNSLKGLEADEKRGKVR